MKNRILYLILIASYFFACSSEEKINIEENKEEEQVVTPIVGNELIKLVSPVEGMTMSSFVASFKANSKLEGPFYLEVSKDVNFEKDVRRITTTSIGNDTHNIYFFKDSKFNLTQGKWYWRVASKKRTDWSDIRLINIDESNECIKPSRKIDPSLPYFHARLRSNICTRPDALSRIQKLIPNDLKEVLILDHPTTWPVFLGGNSVIEYYEKVDQLGYPFSMDLGRPDGADHANQGDRAVTLGEAEYVFQHCKNCVGITTGELFYAYFNDPLVKIFTQGAIDLAAKYGKYFILSDMNWKWNKWSMFCKENYKAFIDTGKGKNFIPLYKTTDPWGALVCMSALQGMGLTGMVGNYGIWSDMWLWEKFGQPENYQNGSVQDFPYIFNMKAFLLSISQGGTVTALEPALAWGDEGIPNENYYKYLIPFLRGVYKHNIMINKSAIQNATKAIVSLNIDPSKVEINYKNDYYGNLYKYTYGLYEGGKEPSKEEIIPNTSKYGIIPFMPIQYAPVPNGMTKYNITDLQSQLNVSNTLGKLYPNNSNEAYAIDLDNTIIILNSNENHDVSQYYNLKLGEKGVIRMFGNIPLMNYIMGKRESSKYWFQVNGYTKGSILGGKYNLSDYPSELNFECTSEPKITLEQPNALVEKKWDSISKVLTIKFQHSEGATNFTISF